MTRCDQVPGAGGYRAATGRSGPGLGDYQARLPGGYRAVSVGCFVLGLDLWRMIGLYISGLALNLVFPFSLGLVLAFVTHRMAQASMPIVEATSAAAMAVIAVMVVLRFGAANRELDYDQRQRRDRVQGWLMRTAVTLGLLAACTWLAGALDRMDLTSIEAALEGTAAATIGGLLAFLVRSDNALAKKLLGLATGLAQLLVVPLLFAVLLRLIWRAEMLSGELPGVGLPVWLVLCAGLLLASLFIDTNRISLHHFYRDRLSEAYQFFDEAQLESYRKLGQAVGAGVFSRELMTGLDAGRLDTDAPGYCEALFSRLHDQHQRACRESGHEHRSSGLRWNAEAQSA